MERRVYIKRAGLAFIGAVAVLTFFSKTIYNSLLPAVTTAEPSSGRLVKTLEADGRVLWGEEYPLYPAFSGRVLEVRKKAGDEVKAGDVLLVMDLKELQNSMRDAELDMQAAELNIRKIKSRQSGLSGGNPALEQKAAEIAAKEKELETNKILYGLGGIPRNDLLRRESELEALHKEYKALLHAEQQNLNDLKLELETALISKTKLENDRRALQERLDTGGKITAPGDGVVLNVNKKVNEPVQVTEELLRIGIRNDSFKAVFEIGGAVDFIRAGDEAVLELKASGEKITGTIERIETAPDKQDVQLLTVAFHGDKLKGGESVKLNVDVQSENYPVILPNQAIRKEGNQYYVFVLKKKEGALGEELYAQRLNVFIGDSDDTNTAVLKGMDFLEPVIVDSSRVISDKMRVKPGESTW